MMHSRTSRAPSLSNLRETFMIGQLSHVSDVRYSKQSDFFVDDKYTIEVGGSSKTGEQLKGLSNAFIASTVLLMVFPDIATFLPNFMVK
jgi:hypothetical protein